MTAARSVAQSRARVGYTDYLAGSHPGGTDDEAACQVLRPCAQYHDRRAIYRGNSYPPVEWVRSPFGGPTDRTSRDARIKRVEIVVRDRVSSLVAGRGGRRREELCPEFKSSNGYHCQTRDQEALTFSERCVDPHRHPTFKNLNRARESPS